LQIQFRAPVLTGGFGLLLPTVRQNAEKCCSERRGADLVTPPRRPMPLLCGDSGQHGPKDYSSPIGLRGW
jgi:hypothetical protein